MAKFKEGSTAADWAAAQFQQEMTAACLEGQRTTITTTVEIGVDLRSNGGRPSNADPEAQAAWDLETLMIMAELDRA